LPSGKYDAVVNMVWLKEIFDLAGSLICHQMPERTLSADGIPLPVCARDMGIYAGIFVSTLSLLALGRWKARKPPGRAVSVVMCLFMMPMILDGGLSYLGITTSDNVSRVVTGVLFGIPIPVFLIPAAHFSVKGGNTEAVLKNWAELLPLYGLGIILSLFLLNGLVPYLAAALIFVFGLVFLLSRLSYTIIKRCGKFKGAWLFITTLTATAGALGIMYLVSSLVLQPLKVIFLKGAA